MGIAFLVGVLRLEGGVPSVSAISLPTQQYTINIAHRDATNVLQNTIKIHLKYMQNCETLRYFVKLSLQYYSIASHR